MKSILVPLTGFENDGVSLEAAFGVASRFAGHLDCLHVCPDPMQIVMLAAATQFTSRMGSVERIHALQREAEARCIAVEDAFRDFKQRHPAAGVAATLEQIDGDPVHDTASAARYRDLTVLARASADGQFAPDAVANILVASGRPMLLVPNTPVAAAGAKIAIAWKESAEAARAVGAALSFLAAAENVFVLSSAEGNGDAGAAAASAEKLAAQLRWHAKRVTAFGLPPALHPYPAVLAKAQELGADLLVAGAYTHSRVHELVFGGFTRELLKACPLPVLLLH